MRRIAKESASTITAAQAAALVQSGMWLDYGLSLSQPDVFDAALAARAAELSDVKIRNCLTLHPRAIYDADPAGERFHVFNWHFGGYDRAKHDAGLCHYIPLNLGEVPDYYRRFIDPVDIVILKTRPLDDEGYFNFGPTNVWLRAIIERARCVIVEEIEDGACLQIGIGGMPNAVCSLLKETGVKDLGIHTEMLTEGLVDLYNAGLVSGARKQLDPGKVAFTFALGSKAVYEAIDRNPDMHCCPVDYTNMPHVIMRNDNVVSINSTTQLDLQGQAASESDGHRHISGTGGQLQFVRGAYASKGGKSFICLPSTYEKKGLRKSRIVHELTAGNIVTTPRSDVMYVVTEYGIANLKGRSVAERARAMISLAHPDFREDLERAAHEHRLIPRGVSFAGARAAAE